LERKPIRKNYKKDGSARRRAKIMQRVKAGLKFTFVVTALLMTSFMFIFGYDFLTQCEYFRAQSLTVSGTKTLTQAHVLKQARLDTGINILSVNLTTVRKRLLTDSWIAAAEVRRELPSKIHIRITEHQPLAVIDLGRKFLINTHGEIFKEVSAADPANLPTISGLNISDVNATGENRGLAFDAVMKVLQLGQKSESVLPNRLIRKIEVDREIGLTIYAPDFESGRAQTIKIGYHDYPIKFSGLKDVMTYLKTKQGVARIDSIDLNDLDRIVVHPAGIESPPNDPKEV